MDCIADLQADHDLGLLPIVDNKRCWFCHRKLRHGIFANRHHLFPQRYVRRGILPGFYKQVWVKAHAFCHALWHSIHDRPDYTWEEYRTEMKFRNYGYGIFISAYWLRQGYTPGNLSRYWQKHHPGAVQAAPFLFKLTLMQKATKNAAFQRPMYI